MRSRHTVSFNSERDIARAMHVKGLIADRHRALVSSANLTDHALDLNMELGFVVGRSVAERLASHFDQLVLQGELVDAFGA